MVDNMSASEKETSRTLLREWQRDDDNTSRTIEDDGSSSVSLSPLPSPSSEALVRTSSASSDLRVSSPASTENSITNEEEERQSLLKQAHLGQDILSSRRPDRISLTVFHHDEAPHDEVFRYDAETESIRLASRQSLLSLPEGNCTEDDANMIMHLQVGDVLVSANEFSCQGLANLDELQSYLAKTRSDTTMTYNFWTTHSVDSRNNNHPPVPVVCQAIVAIPPTDDKTTYNSENNSNGISFGTTKECLLQIQELGPTAANNNHCFTTVPKYSAIQPGHIVVSIGKHREGTCQLDPSDAQLLLDAQQVSSSPSVPYSSITTIATSSSSSPPSTWQQQVRKASVAVGGGTLVGVGAVIMATPLHPIGHAMALGGVGLLGTEFEAPKRAWRRCFSFRRKQQQETEGVAVDDNRVTNDGHPRRE